jgi:chromosome segregation ATPase
MSDTKVIIYDYTSLQRLNEALDYFGDTTLKLLETVSDYLENCLEQFEQQKNEIENQLNSAKDELQSAQESLISARNAYNSCNYMRLMNSGDNNNTSQSDCSSEESAVESADLKVQECTAKVKTLEANLQKADSIIYDFNAEVQNYKRNAASTKENGRIYAGNSGGEKTLEVLANDHTKEAREKLDTIIEFAEKYLGKSNERTEASQQVSTTEELEIMRAGRSVLQAQQYESITENVADANVSMGCEGCGLPVPICTCARSI